MRKSLCALFVFFLALPLVDAEIFKCVRDNGKTVYQNFRCDVDSIGSSATATPPPEEQQPASTSARDQVRPKLVAAQVATPEKSLGPRHEPRIGMTIKEVKASTWGEPLDIVKEEVVEGVIETWHYSGDRTVQFDHTGRVTSVEQ